MHKHNRPSLPVVQPQTALHEEIDPVCGMTVDPQRAASAHVHAGRTYYFCSASCAATFQAEPDRYLGQGPLAAVHTDPVCGMHVRPDHAAGMLAYNGQTYYFCSNACTEKFRAEPERYVVTAGMDAPHSSTVTRDDAVVSTCPMHPEVRQRGPGACPRCGMALEPVTTPAPVARTTYTCPMHPEIVRDQPGSCPICGMALEPRTVSVEEEVNPELVDMTHRFWISLVFTVPLLGLAMSDMLPGRPVQQALSARLLTWLQFVLATPVVLWGGWPFFARGWASLIHRSLNMFTLIAIGTGAAYVYSVMATLVPTLFPDAFRVHSSEVPVYFEAAAVITALVLLGQVLELRARGQTSSAIRALLGLAPKTARLLRDSGAARGKLGE